jgi:cold shock CspA family protein
MVAGRVVRFDGTRGYGFIAPESGGEDVFLHVNDLLVPESQVHSGLAVEFEVEDGGRGLKASSVRLAQRAVTPASSSLSPVASAASEADGTCDVLGAEEFSQEVTELLLKAGSRLTGEQILDVRRVLLKFAEGHGWVED